MPVVRDGNLSAQPNAENVVDSSPKSGLSGSTLNNESPPSEQHEIDSLLRTAEGSSLNTHEHQYPLSPFVYYDDLYFEDSADEQQRLIEAAEEEENGSSMENRALSPTIFYEASSPPLEWAPAASLRSSISSMFTPFNTSTLSTAPNGRLMGRPNRVKQTVAASNEIVATLHHPFMSGAVERDINRAPQGSSSPVPDLSSTGHPAETGTQLNEETVDQPSAHPPDLTEIDGLPSYCCPDASNSLRPLKRCRDEATLESKEGRLKRLRFTRDVYATSSSPELGNGLRKTFSTATTAVNSKHGSPSESVPIDYQQIMRIAIEGIEKPVTITCHEHLFLEVSGLLDSSCFKSKDNMITLYPEERIPHIEPKTIELFVHWLYYNRFTNIGERECGFRQLLELYYLGEAYAMTVLKNVVIDHLIAKFAQYDIPLGCTKRMYNFTTSDDQLRRLWVDFYVWEVPENRFLAEMKSGKLHRLFVQDLALAQMDKIRAMQTVLTQEKPLPMIAPYLKASSAYHMRDAISDACCRRDQYEGEGYFHRMDEHSKRVKFERENASIRATVEKFRMKVERIDIENLDIKRQLRKLQEKVELLVCNAGSKVRDHDFIDHCKLLWSYNFDHPDGLGDSIDCVSGKTSKRGKLVDRLRI